MTPRSAATKVRARHLLDQTVQCVSVLSIYECGTREWHDRPFTIKPFVSDVSAVSIHGFPILGLKYEENFQVTGPQCPRKHSNTAHS